MYPPHCAIQAPLRRIVRLLWRFGRGFLTSDNHSVRQRQTKRPQSRDQAGNHTGDHDGTEIYDFYPGGRTDFKKQPICSLNDRLGDKQAGTEKHRARNRPDTCDQRCFRDKKRKI